jgi:outer membrane protein assembly factor BamB
MLISSLLFVAAMQAAPAREIVADLPNDFLPEGVAWDAKHARFLVSSIRQHRIAAVDPDNGHSSEFADAPGSVLGLHIDRGTVWATWARFGHAAKANTATGIAAWSTRDGSRIGSWQLPDNDLSMNLGDLLVVDARTIVASDSGTGAIWRFDTIQHRFTPLVAAGKFKSPQGMAPAKERGNIYLADYSTGLWRIALKDGAATLLTATAGGEVRGIDGLYRYRDRLIAVQNGTKVPRILAITLGKGDTITDVRRWREMPDTEPSLGVVTDDTFWFVANGQWSAYDDDLAPKPDARREAPLLRGLPLSELAKDR